MNTGLPSRGATYSVGQSLNTSVTAEKEGWKEIEGLAPLQVYPAGIQLFQQSFPAQDVYFISRGLVKLVYVDHSGRELIFGMPSSNALLGATSAILQQRHPLTAVTLTRCDLQRLPADVFRQLLRTNTQLSWHVHRRHCYELYEEVTQMASLKCLSVQHRVEQFLLQLISAMDIKEAQSEIRVHLPFKHWEIAELIAVTPEHFSRVLKRMEQQGTMRREKGRTIVVDYKKLQHSQVKGKLYLMD